MGIQPATTFENYMDTQQDRKYTYNVTKGRVPVTALTVEKQQILHTLSVCL